MHDLVIRGGSVVDGSGADRRSADVAVDGDTITEVGRVVQKGRREIDADGLLVLPGWVDVHTHYDGQATWDAELAPSAWHGVTTAIFGNCSVGFAPVRPGSEGFLINLMEGVEDIPGTALAEGIPFGWESFPEYLDALASKPHTMDIGAQVPHAALRFYVMGERGADHAERPSPDEIAEMGRLTVEGIRAGAFGFTTSRTIKHRAADGRPTPSLSAEDSELLGVAQAMGQAGVGLIQANSDFGSPDEWELLRRMAEVSRRPLTFSLIQVDKHPDQWRQLLTNVEKANADGLHVRAQVGPRAIGIIMGLTATLHPFLGHENFRAIAKLPLAEKVARLRDPDLRRRLLAERPDGPFAEFLKSVMKRAFELTDPPDYEPGPEASLSARAEREGGDAYALALDLMLRDEGRGFFWHPFENYSGCSLDAVREMLVSPVTVAGLSDGGAHVATICDASFPTSLLTHWARDRQRGEKLPLEFVVQRQTRATAELFGLLDRGLVAPGMRADLNVVDFEGLRLHTPELIGDLPAGGKRLVQRVDGYRHTISGGQQTYEDGEWTGATPGGLLRGPRAA